MDPATVADGIRPCRTRSAHAAICSARRQFARAQPSPLMQAPARPQAVALTRRHTQPSQPDAVPRLKNQQLAPSQENRRHHLRPLPPCRRLSAQAAARKELSVEPVHDVDGVPCKPIALASLPRPPTVQRRLFTAQPTLPSLPPNLLLRRHQSAAPKLPPPTPCSTRVLPAPLLRRHQSLSPCCAHLLEKRRRKHPENDEEE